MTNTEIATSSKIMCGEDEFSKMYIGNTLVYQQYSLLPLGYTLLKYISSTSTGSQYIDLNIKLYETLGTNYDIAIKYNVHGVGSDNNQPTLFSCQNTTNPWPGTFIRMSLATATFTTGRYIGGTAKDNNLGNNGSIIELPVQTPPNKNVTSFNNSSNITHNFGTSLFCIFSDSNNTPLKFIDADLYYFKLIVNGVLVRDMVPCIDPNNVVGLYDVVNGIFYSSPNGAAFVAGPKVSNVNAKFLDILYSDTYGKLSISSRVLPSSLGKTPIGLCIAPTGFFGVDEPARWMSLTYMSYSTPLSGSAVSSSQKMKWGGYISDETMYVLNAFNCIWNGSPYNTSYGYFADWGTNALNKSIVIPTLFTENNEWNLLELGTLNQYSVTTINGKSNTLKILSTVTAQPNWRTDPNITNSTNEGYATAACCCACYRTLGTQPGDWYLGAGGEMSIIVAKLEEINAKLLSIKGMYYSVSRSSLRSGGHWTSTIKDGTWVSLIDNSDGSIACLQHLNENYVLALLQY